MYFVMIKRSLNTQFISPAKYYFIYIHRTAPKVFDSRPEFFAFLCIVKAGSFVYIRVSTFFTAIEHFVRVNFTSLHIFKHSTSRCTRTFTPRIASHQSEFNISRREFTQPMNIISCRDHRFRGILSAKT